MVNNWRSDRVFSVACDSVPPALLVETVRSALHSHHQWKRENGYNYSIDKKRCFLTKLAFGLNELIGLGNFHLNELIEPGLP